MDKRTVLLLALSGSACNVTSPTSRLRMAGDWNHVKIALDAPWRLEPGHGSIPIQVTIYDAIKARSLFGMELDRIESVTVTEVNHGQTYSRKFPLAAFHEIETTFGSRSNPDSAVWQWSATPCDPNVFPRVSNTPEAVSLWHAACPDEVPQNGFTSRLWQGEVIEASDVGATSEWHGTLLYPLQGSQEPGTDVQLKVTMEFIEDDPIFDDHERVTHTLSVHLGEAPLPRFSAEWAYGDIHYHAQLTNNFAEQGYSFRGALHAMSAIGLDFAFATDHSSNNKRLFNGLLQYYGLGDASPTKWAFAHWLLNDRTNGANHDIILDPSTGTVPQLFLGSEVDVIPETADPERLGFSLATNRIESVCEPEAHCDPDKIRDATADGTYLIHDFQGHGSTAFDAYARQHLLHLPRDASRQDAGVFGNTSKFGGATRRLKDVIATDLEQAGKGYMFLAHPFAQDTSPGEGRRGPDIIPYSKASLLTALRSPHILGLEFWNGNTHFSTHLGYVWDNVSQADDLNPFTRSGWFDKSRTDEDWTRDLSRDSAIWDDVLFMGMDPAITVSIPWLPKGEPRRFFMAGGSDAHGDLNYSRQGAINGVNDVSDTALGNPRNLVFVGKREHETALSQEQTVDGLRSGNFSITDGPALRILIDADGNGVASSGDIPMGQWTTRPTGSAIPLIVQWLSTPEFGGVTSIQIYVGMMTNGKNVVYQGDVFGMNLDSSSQRLLYPRESLSLPDIEQTPRFLVSSGDSPLAWDVSDNEKFAGQKLIFINPLAWNKEWPQSLFVRSLAKTTDPRHTKRHAFTNPIWITFPAVARSRRLDSRT